MANTTATAIGNQQLYNNAVLRGFVATVAPLRAFSLDVSPAPAEKGQTVNVTFVPSGSAVQAWTDAGGYTTQTGTREAISVALSNHYFVGTALSDIEIANSSLVRLEDMGMQNGRDLGLYVLQNVLSAVSASSFPTGHLVSTSSLLTVDDLVTVRKTASQLKWGLTRNIITNVNGFYALLKDDDLKYIYRGDSNVVQNGQITNVFGWNNIYEANGFPSNMLSGSTTPVYGMAVTPDALCVAMRYLTPAPESNGIVESYPLTDPATGITIGARKWYDANAGKTKLVYECVWGKAVANKYAAINLAAGLDA